MDPVLVSGLVGALGSVVGAIAGTLVGYRLNNSKADVDFYIDNRVWMYYDDYNHFSIYVPITLINEGSQSFTITNFNLLLTSPNNQKWQLRWQDFAQENSHKGEGWSVERVSSPICGAINGMLTGLTGTLFIPGVMFLQAIGLSKDALVQAMGMLFAASTASLGLALYWNGLMPFDVGILSCGALLPALFGMRIGQTLRGHFSQDLFRRLFLIAIGGLGGHILLS